MDFQERKSFLKEIPPFSLLEEPILDYLVRYAEEKNYHEGSFVFKQGEFTQGYLYIVIKGQIQIVVTDSQHINRVVGHRHPKDFFGETAFFTRDEYPASAQAVKETNCLRLPEKQFMKAMAKSLDFAFFFNRLLVDRMRLLYQKFMFEDDVKNLSPLFRRKAVELMSGNVVTCSPEDTVVNVALALIKGSVSTVVVVQSNDSGEAGEYKRPIGIITERDLVTRVVAAKMDLANPLYHARHIMSSNLIIVSSDAYLHQVFLLMTKHNIKHIVVSDVGILKGVITLKDLVGMQSQQPLSIVTDIESIDSIIGLPGLSEKIHKVIFTLLQEKAEASDICAIISEYYDRVTRRVIELAELNMQKKGKGRPPSDYCMIIMGSGGRKEQYSTTDQDHAIVFDSPVGQEDRLRPYFLELGEEIVSGLETFGFKRCKGEVMANNRNWCLSLHEWIVLIEKWGTYLSAEIKSIMQMSIFLDFRWIYGKKELSEELKNFVTAMFMEKGQPIRFLAQDSALSKGSPITMFGRVRTRSGSKGAPYVDLKRDGCIHVVDCVRVFSLKHGIKETNTGERIARLKQLGVFKESFQKDIEDIREAYEILMKFRIQDAYDKIRSKKDPDNRLNWDMLTKHEKALLRQSLAMVNRILSITNYYFRRDDRFI